MSFVNIAGWSGVDGRVTVGPWFRERPGMATGVAATFIVACSVLGAALPDNRVLVLAVLALPVSLMAVTFGSRGGMAAGVVALALAAIWSLPMLGAEVGAAGWAAAAALLVLGGLLGEAEDTIDATDRRAMRAEADRARLECQLRRHAEAVEINDLMVQSVAVAKWALEAGDRDRAMEVLDEIGDKGQRLVSSLLRDADPSPRKVVLTARVTAPDRGGPSSSV